MKPFVIIVQGPHMPNKSIVEHSDFFVDPAQTAPNDMGEYLATLALSAFCIGYNIENFYIDALVESRVKDYNFSVRNPDPRDIGLDYNGWCNFSQQAYGQRFGAWDSYRMMTLLSHPIRNGNDFHFLTTEDKIVLDEMDLVIKGVEEKFFSLLGKGSSEDEAQKLLEEFEKFDEIYLEKRHNAFYTYFLESMKERNIVFFGGDHKLDGLKEVDVDSYFITAEVSPSMRGLISGQLPTFSDWKSHDKLEKKIEAQLRKDKSIKFKTEIEYVPKEDLYIPPLSKVRL